MTTATTLTTDGALAVAAALRIQTLPLALALHPRHTDHRELDAARDAALSDLRERGVLNSDDEVRDDELATALLTIAHPERQLVARILRGENPDADTMIRFCLARRGLDHAVAIRTDDTLEIASVWVDADPLTLTRPLLSALGPCEPAEIAVCSAPTDELRRFLDATDAGHTGGGYAPSLSEPAAAAIGSALRQRHSVAEIVCYSHRDGRAVRSPAAAAVYDTAAGRIVGGGSVTADGQTWTTLSPGSDHRLTQVIATLIESLPEGGWMP
ncbi:ESX secretion-associated protein EspG [Nocardia macrotermitis]|uniref:ESX-1 secretion-associated protein EspG1 n=1 Tax=Nocardia macrotermitis TaxID=2585198 RepID=A0A7K0DAA6_9NOCA|nr:ESX secretion-associated protein EspG [Nocardia macrotermitis]MQY22481.1 ESX-1 secretion-associated protein EspG1 [Nocardia macrotermitis]